MYSKSSCVYKYFYKIFILDIHRLTMPISFRLDSFLVFNVTCIFIEFPSLINQQLVAEGEVITSLKSLTRIKAK